MKKIERFILRDILSDGPAGTVYKAEEVLPGDNRRTVALKVLPPLAGALTGESPAEVRFFGEVRVLAQLAVHPHIVTIYAMGLTDGYPWLSMEYAPATLQNKMTDAPDPASVDDIVRLLEQVARGLATMHMLKPPLIHQDLKPANLLIDVVGNYKITDFSLATVTAAHKTHGLATVRYAAPELLSSEFGGVSSATDLYALGHIAYEYALGAVQHRRQFPAVFEGNSNKEPPPNKWMMWHASISMRPAPLAEVLRGFPGTLSEIIGRLMAKQPAERYGRAEDLLSDLAVFCREIAGADSAPLPVSRPAAQPVAVTSTGATRSNEIPFAQPDPVPSPTVPTNAYSPPTSTPNANARYWVRLRGKVTGPFDLAALQRQVKQGQISRLHQVSTDQATWKQATEVEGLYGPASTP